MGKITALDTANYFVYLLSGVCDDLTNMKVNKMLYYAQGHYLKSTGTPLFDDEIEAWSHGPVVNAVYQVYKGYGDNPITECDAARAEAVSDDVADFLLGVGREYSRFTASALRNMTHVVNGPWDKVYNGHGRHIVIPLDSIKVFFEKNISDIAPVTVPLTEDCFVGYRDENGFLVLPKEWNDEAV